MSVLIKKNTWHEFDVNSDRKWPHSICKTSSESTSLTRFLNKHLRTSGHQKWIAIWNAQTVAEEGRSTRKIKKASPSSITRHESRSVKGDSMHREHEEFVSTIYLAPQYRTPPRNVTSHSALFCRKINVPLSREIFIQDKPDDYEVTASNSLKSLIKHWQWNL